MSAVNTNAVNPLPSSPSGVDPRPHEPSMEEILASIRRIIADDQPSASAAEAVPPSPGAAPLRGMLRERLASRIDDASGEMSDRPRAETGGAREATAPRAADDAAAAGLSAYGQVMAPQFPTPDGLPPERAGADRVAAEPIPPREAAGRPAALFSPSTDQSLSSAFNMLAATRLADNSEELMTMARDMIRPLLKTWLDDNLPSLVERLVRAEIERVARGGR